MRVEMKRTKEENLQHKIKKDQKTSSKTIFGFLPWLELYSTTFCLKNDKFD
jgi:chloramphenicol O-acetyltransferase